MEIRFKWFYKLHLQRKNSQKPEFLILPAWHGIDKASKDITGELAALGYYAFIADIYGEYQRQCRSWSKSGYYKTNYKEYQTKFH
jgi:dienelactone hydrolase